MLGSFSRLGVEPDGAALTGAAAAAAGAAAGAAAAAAAVTAVPDAAAAVPATGLLAAGAAELPELRTRCSCERKKERKKKRKEERKKERKKSQEIESEGKIRRTFDKISSHTWIWTVQSNIKSYV